MEYYDSEMKRIGDYIKVKRYGKKIRKRDTSKKTKAERQVEIMKVERDSGLSTIEKMIKIAILKNNGAKEREYSKKEKREPKARKLTIKEKETFGDLMDMNFKLGDKYVTLTYAKENVSLEQASRDFDNWIKRMRDKYSDFKYLAVRSFQNRGTVHFHVLINIPDIPTGELRNGVFQDIWGHGIVNVKNIYSPQFIDKYARLKNYLIKNLFEFKADKRSFGKRLYLQSSNLEKPKIIKGNYTEIMESLKNLEGNLKKVDGYKITVDFLNYIQSTTFKIVWFKNEN